MIKIKSKYYADEELTKVQIIHSKSCNMEFLSVISKMMDLMEEYGNITRKEIYKCLKDMDKVIEKEVK